MMNNEWFFNNRFFFNINMISIILMVIFSYTQTGKQFELNQCNWNCVNIPTLSTIFSATGLRPAPALRLRVGCAGGAA